MNSLLREGENLFPKNQDLISKDETLKKNLSILFYLSKIVLTVMLKTLEAQKLLLPPCTPSTQYLRTLLLGFENLRKKNPGHGQGWSRSSAAHHFWPHFPGCQAGTATLTVTEATVPPLPPSLVLPQFPLWTFSHLW